MYDANIQKGDSLRHLGSMVFTDEGNYYSESITKSASRKDDLMSGLAILLAVIYLARL